MKYLQGRKKFELILLEKEIPSPVHNQVLVKVLACGVCGTDLHFLNKNEKYTALGHEISASVVSIGESVTKVFVGEMVVVEDNSACGSCDHCRNGESYLCRNMTGLEGQSGMGEYLLVHENNLLSCKNLTREQATFVEPSAVALTACLNAEIKEDRPLVIWGLGPLALMCVALGKYYHAKEIVCVGHKRNTVRGRKRAETAIELGADRVCYTGETDWEREIPEDTGSVIVSSPPLTVPDAVRLAGYGGVIVPFGIALDATSKVTLDLDDMIFRKKKIVPVLTEPSRLFPRCIDLIRNNIIPVDKLLTHQIRLNDTDKFRDIYMRDTPIIKGIVITD